MNVANPRRILAVSLAESSDHLSRVVKDLTGTNPLQSLPSVSSSNSQQQESSSLAGTTHTLPLSTAYYKADIPLWLDLISDPAEWADSFLSEEAREVLEVLGGLVVVFSLKGTTGTDTGGELIRQVGRVVKEGLGGWEWDGVGVVVGVGDVAGGEGRDEGEVLDEWEDICAGFGMEFVHVRTTTAREEGRNEFGEKMGIARIREALEANDWAQAGGFDDGGDGDGPDGFDEEVKATEEDGPSELNPEDLEFGFDREDFAGLKKAIWSSGRAEDGDEEGDGETQEDDDVQKLEGMMKKLLAVREMSAGLPEEQRRRMASRAVGEVMKEL
ncbi:hypothetical protein GE09DRAFT_1193702 [Coniochaeta sp. 2T2.1]|nr:hypothetical protein GE09DRAFT_1193702 [Coniochaeta sp. 2T2.1]